LDIISPCVTFNMLNTYPWFKERVYKLEEDAGYDPTDLMAALAKSLEFGERIPIGLLYRSERPTYEDTEPVLGKGPLVEQPLGLDRAALDAILAETM
jgi:2-oxoglutarate ferredoxin oxidoreductase subunit beta